jgi:serine palmitoyltransferase
MLVGSVSNGLNSSAGFCTGSHIVVDHQCINGTSFVIFATVPALHAVSASEGIIILRNTPSIFSTQQETVRTIRAVVAQGVWITHACRLRGQELVEARPSIRLAVTAALSRKECEHAAGVIKAGVTKVLAKRK